MVQYQNSIKKLVLFSISLLLSSQVYAQIPIDTTISSAITTAQAINATHSITLSPGFSADGTNGAVTFSIVSPALFSCTLLNAVPSPDQNYISTYVPRIAIADPGTLSAHTACDVMQMIQYLDGLGRPIQTVQVKGNPGGTKDVIQPAAYDVFGREATKYLPYTTGSGTPGSYRPDALNGTSGYNNSAQYSFYQPQTSQNYTPISIPSASTGFEPSPLDRVVEQGAPGADWQLGNHTNRIVYASNDGTTYWSKQFAVNIDGNGVRTLIDQGSYGANQLYVTVSQNENWPQTQSIDVRLNTTEEYKDKEGHVVLKRTYNNNTSTTPAVFETLSTYYVYDDFGNLCYVLPPKAEADGGLSSSGNPAIITNLCYQYTYDERNRLSSKQLPGKGVEYLVYNTLDQVVATQDANQRAINQWVITKYDALGRGIMTGIWTNNNTAISPTNLKTLVYAQSANWETRDNTQTYGYTQSNTYPNTLDNVLTVNYYDDYSFPAIFNPAPYVVNSQITPAMPSTQSTMTKGLLTGSLTAILNGTNNNTDATNMLWSVNYYDDKGRVIQANEQHYLGGTVNAANYDQISNSYDFTNEITQTIRNHYNTTGTNPAVTITNNYVYDHMGRKRQSFEQINGGTNVLLSQNDYNEVGQELNKHLHSTDNGISFIQTVIYSYNERGWLTSSNTDGNLLNLSLNYNLPGTGITQQWNGNISAMGYNINKPTPASKQFLYTYDALNRLTIALSADNQLDELISYDKMGNILSMNRDGNSAMNLSYNYLDASSNYSNQLTKVSNISDNSTFRTYAYDGNGNAKSDGGIQAISYNMLNLPQSVTQGGAIKTTYTYDASGTKLRNTGSDGTWDYINGIVYNTPPGSIRASISFIQTEEGRASRSQSDGTYHYEYNLKDHLGNTRVSFDNDPANTGHARVIQEDEYYSFGLRKPGGYDLSNNNRYLYNGKEIQTDLANQYDYGARFYDPVIGRFTSIDPLAEKGRRWSPYSYGMDDPILMVDPDGMWPFPVLIRSFAPFKSFGLGFAGDNRGYSTSSTATSRVAQSFTVDPAKGTHTAPLTSSSPSEHPLLGTATAKDDKGSITNFNSTANKDGSNTVSFTSNMAGGNPLTRNLDIPTPDIDVHTNFTMTENDKAGTLNVNAVQTGDAFPSAETMMGDTKGNQLFIGVSAANGSPFTSLEGDNNRPMMQANFTITMDSKGVFTGVQQGDKKYSTADWNKMNQNKPTVQQ